MRDVRSITYAGVVTARRMSFTKVPVSNVTNRICKETYDLEGRDEEHIQQEERNSTYILLDDLPPIVFTADLIASLPPVVVCKPQ
jgi:hypothetical protein